MFPSAPEATTADCAALSAFIGLQPCPSVISWSYVQCSGANVLQGAPAVQPTHDTERELCMVAHAVLFTSQLVLNRQLLAGVPSGFMHVACAAAGCCLTLLSGWPAGLPSALHIAQEGVEMAVTMGMQLPPLNAPLVLQRFITEMGMPQVGRAVALPKAQRPAAPCCTKLWR